MKNKGELNKGTEVEFERFKKCPSCGEPLSGKLYLVEIYRNCVTVECFSCGAIQDIWKRELSRA